MLSIVNSPAYHQVGEIFMLGLIGGGGISFQDSRDEKYLDCATVNLLSQ